MSRKAFKVFLRQRREELGLTQVMVAKALGYKNASQYSVLENRGGIPTNPTKVQKLATVLQTTPGELRKIYGAYEELESAQDILPLLKAIAGSNCRTVSRQDLDALLKIQADLGGATLPPELVDQLMKHRLPENSRPVLLAKAETG